MMTEWYWSPACMHLQRCVGYVYKMMLSMRQEAEQIEDVMMKLFPVSWEALRMYAE